MAVYKHKNNNICNRLQQYFSQIETEHYHKLKDAEFKLQPSVDFRCYENADVMKTIYNLGHCSQQEVSAPKREVFMLSCSRSGSLFNV